MDIYEAVTSRRAVRGFTDEPVSRKVLERVLSAAAWSPSGSNIQPWNIYVLTGARLAELKTRAVERVAHGDPWDERQYEMCPHALKSPYGERRSAFGKERYSALACAVAASRYRRLPLAAAARNDSPQCSSTGVHKDTLEIAEKENSQASRKVTSSAPGELDALGEPPRPVGRH